VLRRAGHDVDASYVSLTPSSPQDDYASSSHTSCAIMRMRSLTAPPPRKIVTRILAELAAYNATSNNCPMFMRNYQSEDAYTFWTPWQPESTLGKWGSNLPCQNPFFCDRMFSLAESRDAALLIYEHQHPRDCNNSRYLVITDEWLHGFGSAIHVKSEMLVKAIQMGRVLIDSHENKWKFSNPSNCNQGNMSCYFSRITHCTLPKDWMNAAQPLASLQTSSHSDAQYVFTPSLPAFVLKYSSLHAPKGLGYDHKSLHWWATHASAYIIRPNLQTLQATCCMWNCITGGIKQPDRPFAAMFVRSGDKYKEARMFEPHDYFNRLYDVSQNLTSAVRSVYVSSDSALILNRMLQDYGADWKLMWVGNFRSANGSHAADESATAFTPEIQMRALFTLADIYISAAADVLVGTLSSNQCRLMDELRKVQGKARIPYVSPEDRLVAGISEYG
jgi:hypothetical protein